MSPRLCYYLDPAVDRPAGGAQRQQSMIAAQLVKKGYDVSALVADYGETKRVSHRDIDLMRGLPETVSGPMSAINGVLTLARYLQSDDSQIYLVRGAPRLAAATFLITRLLGKKFVLRIANNSDVDKTYLSDKYSLPLFSSYVRTMYNADNVIAQTKQQKRVLENDFGIEPKVIPNGYHIPSSEDVYPHDKRDDILWVGSSDPAKKNPSLFISLAKQVGDLEFTMISQPLPGKERYHEEIKEEARSVENLNFKGPVAPDEVHDYYRRAILLVNTSEYEGFPNTFLEAWRYETPVLSLHFDLDGLLERECGGIHAGSMNNLATLLRRLSSDHTYRRALGSAGRKHMEENFSLSRVANLYDEELRKAQQ